MFFLLASLKYSGRIFIVGWITAIRSMASLGSILHWRNWTVIEFVLDVWLLVYLTQIQQSIVLFFKSIQYTVICSQKLMSSSSAQPLIRIYDSRILSIRWVRWVNCTIKMRLEYKSSHSDRSTICTAMNRLMNLGKKPRFIKWIILAALYYLDIFWLYFLNTWKSTTGRLRAGDSPKSSNDKNTSSETTL